MTHTEVALDRMDQELVSMELDLATKSNLSFTAYTNLDYEINWHHQVVGWHLDNVLAGRCKRLMVFEPPQNGKSEQVSRRFPAYAFGKFPDTRIIGTSYSMSLAQDMSRDVQKIMMTPEYQEIFPETRLATGRDEEKKTQGHFEIVGHRGYYIAAGVDGPITGKSLDIGIIDDPVKNREEAESEVYQLKVWNWYKSAFLTRQFGGDAAIIICLTRWHMMDLAGRLLALAKEDPNADQWTVVSIPAILEREDQRTKGDPRAIGEPIWPKKYSRSWLINRKATLGEYDWSALYQQEPKPAGGGLFKETWFKIVDASPVHARRVRGWDTAGTEKGGDYTVGVKIAEPVLTDTYGNVSASGQYYIEDVQRNQFGPDGVDKLIKLTADMDGVEVSQREEKEGGSAGLAVIAARTKSLAGKDYSGVTVTGSKVTRARPFRAQCEAGNVFLVRGPWNAEYIKELCDFPTGGHDDQVDATSNAFNSVLLEPLPEPLSLTWG